MTYGGDAEGSLVWPNVEGGQAVLQDSNTGLFPGSPVTVWQRLVPLQVAVE